MQLNSKYPHPWDSPGKNTGVGCHFLLQCMKVKSESEVTQSCPTPVTPWTAAYQAPPSMGFSRQKYWSGVPLPSLIDQTGENQFLQNIVFIAEHRTSVFLVLLCLCSSEFHSFLHLDLVCILLDLYLGMNFFLFLFFFIHEHIDYCYCCCSVA